MRLHTDYEQWYDFIFDDQPPVFQRRAFSRGGLSKRAQFELFRSLRLAMPPHGLVHQLPAQMEQAPADMAVPQAARDEVRCVVYLDEYGHAGEGKVLLTLADACEKFPDHFGSLFIPPFGAPVIFRLVRFGRFAFWLRQQGDPAGWQSNRRDDEQVLGKIRCADPAPIPRVLWAIDFLPSPFGLLAIDFNTAPQLATLGETHVLSPEEVRIELQHAAQSAPQHLEQW